MTQPGILLRSEDCDEARAYASAVERYLSILRDHHVPVVATELVQLEPAPGRRAERVGARPQAESSTSPARARNSGGPLARRPSSKMSPSGARPLQRMVWEWMPRW